MSKTLYHYTFSNEKIPKYPEGEDTWKSVAFAALVYNYDAQTKGTQQAIIKGTGLHLPW